MLTISLKWLKSNQKTKYMKFTCLHFRKSMEMNNQIREFLDSDVICHPAEEF